MTALIATAEGARRRFEVLQSIDGYTVRATDLATGRVEGQGGTLFRTAPAAFAYAELVASIDRLATVRGSGSTGSPELDLPVGDILPGGASSDDGFADDLAGDLLEQALEHHACERRFEELRRALGDDGVPGQLLEAWEQADARAARMRFH